MTEEESLSAAIREDIGLQEYDSSWPLKFAAERQRLETLFPTSFVDIQHIGSTAVPGLKAKPIIDLMAGVEAMAMAERLAEPICGAGYTTSREFNALLLDRKWFMRWFDGQRTHHLHLVAYESAAWRQRLKFRDALRASDVLAHRYAQLKTELAARHRNDREAYTDAKADFVRLISGND